MNDPMACEAIGSFLLSAGRRDSRAAAWSIMYDHNREDSSRRLSTFTH